jgi:hypothetical protein
MRDDENLMGRHLAQAHGIKGEHRLAEYVVNLDLGGCAQILAASRGGSPFLASHRDECRGRPR